MKQTMITIALLGAMTHPFAVYAETPSLDEVVVTATRFAAPSESSLVNVTVITASDIEKTAARTLPALLAQYAGIQVRSTDGTSDMSIDSRGFGMTGNQNTLVLLDGQRLNDIELTSIRWSAIPIASIERIEIINGSGAVLYGAGAAGGTINIITRRPVREMRGKVSAGLGSYDAQEWQLALSGAVDRVGMRITASGLDSSNYRANNNIAQNNLEADLRTDAGRGEAIMKFGTDSQNLRYPGPRRFDPNTGLDQIATDPRSTSTPLDYGKRDGNHISLGTTQQFDPGELAAELSYRDKNQQAYFAAFGGNYLNTDLNLISFTPRMRVAHQMGGSENELVAGVDIAYWDYDSSRSNSPDTIGTPATHILARQVNRALYAQNTMQLGANTRLALGARSQRVEYQARDTVNPAVYASGNQGRTINVYELGFHHNLNPVLSMFGRVGRSFRIAAVDEIFDQFGGPLWDSRITFLEPQISRDSEAGVVYKSGKNKLRATFFRMNLSNEIHYNAITFANINLSPTRRYGMELDGAHACNDKLEVAAAYSYTVAKFRDGSYGGINVAGNNIPLVPRQRLALSATWKLSEKTAFNSSILYVGEQHFDNDQANTFARKMPAYTTADIKMTHRDGAWSFSAAINNLFNEKYFTYAIASTFTPGVYNAYPMQARNFSLNLGREF